MATPMPACFRVAGCCQRHPKACGVMASEPNRSVSRLVPVARPPRCPSAPTRQAGTAVAILFAGPPFHKHAPGYDYVEEFQRALVAPLLNANISVSIFATGANEAEIAGWRRFLAKLKETCTVEVWSYLPLPDRSTTRFSDAECKHRHMKSSAPCINVLYIWSHLDSTFQLLRHHEARVRLRPFDYLIKARNDFVYRPGHCLDVAWLLSMPTDVLAVPSVEMHTTDRWLERSWGSGATWPDVVNDQLAFGPRFSMGAYFELLRNHEESTRMPRPPGHMEGMLSHYLRHARSPPLQIVTVELQYSQPGGKYINGRDGQWVNSHCRWCWKPEAGGAAMGGVGGGLTPVATCANNNVTES